MKNLLALLALSLCLAVGAARAQAADESALIAGRTETREMAQDALATLYELQPTARLLIEHAAGYGVFSTFGIKILFGGGSSGKGMIVNNRTHRQTFMKMVGVQAGLGFGVKKDRLIFVFETEGALREFVKQGWEFGASGSLAATADKQGAMFTGAASVSPGVYVYQITDAGLVAQITASGTRFYKDDALN